MVSSKVNQAIINLREELNTRDKRTPLSFECYLDLVANDPLKLLRPVSSHFYDMINYYVPPGVDEHPDEDSIGYVDYDFSKLFVEGCDTPFFADRIFANRLMNIVNNMPGQDNKILLVQGGPGCGKSTFLNKLVNKYEEFTKESDGIVYETLWRFDLKKFGLSPFLFNSGMGGDMSSNPHPGGNVLQEDVGGNIGSGNVVGLPDGGNSGNIANECGMQLNDYFDVPCPSHCHPITVIPNDMVEAETPGGSIRKIGRRRKFLEDIVHDKDIRKELFYNKKYSWLTEKSACPICTSVYRALIDKFDPKEVLDMIHARRYNFDRKNGIGVTIFTPKDPIMRKPNFNSEIQGILNKIFKDSNLVNYIYSNLAKTNNGLYALGDIKKFNKERFDDLHGIVSEGYHKVGGSEETIDSILIGLINPDDDEIFKKDESFVDRIEIITMPYVLDYKTEIEIYKNKLGRDIDDLFLPGVLKNFAKVIISSRLNKKSNAIEEWLQDKKNYARQLDEHRMLPKMEIYSGNIPGWLTENDIQRFNTERRRAVIAESEDEGKDGITERDSIKWFTEFYKKCKKENKPISMRMINDFFNKDSAKKKSIPKSFLSSLTSLYKFEITEQIKEALYDYNEEGISKTIQNYMFFMTCDFDSKEECPYTGEKVKVTPDYLRDIESVILGKSDEKARLGYRANMLKYYNTQTLPEILHDGKDVKETEQYQKMFRSYNKNIKDNVLIRYIDNENFYRAVKDYYSDEFKTYDKRLRDDVGFMIGNLVDKFKYTEKSARDIVLYAIEEIFSKKNK